MLTCRLASGRRRLISGLGMYNDIDKQRTARTQEIRFDLQMLYQSRQSSYHDVDVHMRTCGSLGLDEREHVRLTQSLSLLAAGTPISSKVLGPGRDGAAGVATRVCGGRGMGRSTSVCGGRDTGPSTSVCGGRDGGAGDPPGPWPYACAWFCACAGACHDPWPPSYASVGGRPR